MLHVGYTVYVHVGYINNIHPVDTIIYMFMLHVEYTVYVTCGVYK